MPDQYAKVLAEYIKDSATTWIRGLESVPEGAYLPGGEAGVRWMSDGTAVIRDVAGDDHGPYRVTVIVEPVETWHEVTWYDVALCTPESPRPEDTRPLVRLAGVEAVVLSAVAQRWHVDPHSHPRYPLPLEHDVIVVKLQLPGQEPKLYRMPPDGKVMMRSGEPVAPAVANILNAFPGSEVAS